METAARARSSRCFDSGSRAAATARPTAAGARSRSQVHRIAQPHELQATRVNEKKRSRLGQWLACTRLQAPARGRSRIRFLSLLYSVSRKNLTIGTVTSCESCDHSSMKISIKIAQYCSLSIPYLLSKLTICTPYRNT